MGGSVALIGAARVADSLRSHTGNYPKAFQEYYDLLSPLVKERQVKAALDGMALMFPSDDAELSERNNQLSQGTVKL